MDRSKAMIGQVVCAVAAGILFLIAKVAEIEVFYVLSFVPLIAAFVFACFNRCPSCGRSLSRHHFFIEYCPYCGEYL